MSDTVTAAVIAQLADGRRMGVSADGRTFRHLLATNLRCANADCVAGAEEEVACTAAQICRR
jgi:hypothetical protein